MTRGTMRGVSMRDALVKGGVVTPEQAQASIDRDIVESAAVAIIEATLREAVPLFAGKLPGWVGGVHARARAGMQTTKMTGADIYAKARDRARVLMRKGTPLRKVWDEHAPFPWEAIALPVDAHTDTITAIVEDARKRAP